jgi:hypothetical protein
MTGFGQRVFVLLVRVPYDLHLVRWTSHAKAGEREARSRTSRRIAIAAFAAALALMAPAVARAAGTFCVHQTGSCPAAQVDEGSDLQAALGDAAGSAGNTVLIGPGTYTHAGGFDYVSNTNPVTITGAGVDATFLRATGGSSSAMHLAAPSPTQLSGLTVERTSNLTISALYIAGPTGSSTTGALATSVATAASGSGTIAEDGAVVAYGATLARSTIDGTINTAGDATMTDDAITAPVGVYASTGQLTAARLTIVAQQSGVVALVGSDVTVDGLLMRGSGASGAAAFATDGGQLTIRSGTFAIESGSWYEAQSENANSPSGTSSVTILDSIFSGFTQGTTCNATAGTADLTFGYDDRHVFGPESCTGGGTFTAGSANIDADPRFVNPAADDYHLLWSSPAIDAGQPNCGTPCQDSDLDGLTRPIDGNGDGTATRDMGAYEYGHRPPVAQAAASPASAAVGQPVAFSGIATDPDDGDTLSLAWRFDDGTTATGAAVSHAFATPGVHTGTVTATDPTGLTATAAASITIPVPRDTTPPTVSSLKTSPSTFTVAKAGTATIAKAQPRRHRRGTKIEFKLSEPAEVVIAFARRTAGINVGRSCQAPSRKHRHGKACTRYVGSGSLTRRSEPAGAVSIPFTGRVGRRALAHGHYRLTLTATDPAGNASKPRTATFKIVSR